MLSIHFHEHFPTEIRAKVLVETSDGKVFEDHRLAFEHSKTLYMIEALRAHFDLPKGETPQETSMRIMKEVARTGDARCVDDAYDRMLRLITTKGHG